MMSNVPILAVLSELMNKVKVGWELNECLSIFVSNYCLYLSETDDFELIEKEWKLLNSIMTKLYLDMTDKGVKYQLQAYTHLI